MTCATRRQGTFVLGLTVEGRTVLTIVPMQRCAPRHPPDVTIAGFAKLHKMGARERSGLPSLGEDWLLARDRAQRARRQRPGATGCLPGLDPAMRE